MFAKGILGLDSQEKCEAEIKKLTKALGI